MHLLLLQFSIFVPCGEVLSCNSKTGIVLPSVRYKSSNFKGPAITSLSLPQEITPINQRSTLKIPSKGDTNIQENSIVTKASNNLSTKRKLEEETIITGRKHPKLQSSNVTKKQTQPQKIEYHSIWLSDHSLKSSYLGQKHITENPYTLKKEESYQA